MANLFDPDWDVEQDLPPFTWRRARLGRQAGSEQLGASLFEIPPGAATFPLHAHFNNEEMLLVLAGSLRLTRGDGSTEALQAGDVVACLAGHDGAHRLDNDGDEPARLLIVSTMKSPEINAMLEDGTYWVRDYAPGLIPEEPSLDVQGLRESDAR